MWSDYSHEVDFLRLKVIKYLINYFEVMHSLLTKQKVWLFDDFDWWLPLTVSMLKFLFWKLWYVSFNIFRLCLVSKNNLWKIILCRLLNKSVEIAITDKTHRSASLTQSKNFPTSFSLSGVFFVDASLPAKCLTREINFLLILVLIRPGSVNWRMKSSD